MITDKCFSCKRKDGSLLCGICGIGMNGEREYYMRKPITNADRIRAMTDEELAELIGDNIDCAICKKEIFQITTCPGSLTVDGKGCYGCWLDRLRQEAKE